MLGRLPEYIWQDEQRSPSEASQPEAPIGQNKATRGRMVVTWMASLHERSYSRKATGSCGRSFAVATDVCVYPQRRFSVTLGAHLA